MCYIRFFERVDLLTPEYRELAFFNLNSHYIVAVLSPILLIVMLVMPILTMTSKNKLGPYITAIMTIPVSSTVPECSVQCYSNIALHMHSANTLIFGYSNALNAHTNARTYMLHETYIFVGSNLSPIEIIFQPLHNVTFGALLTVEISLTCCLFLLSAVQRALTVVHTVYICIYMCICRHVH